MPEPSLYYYKCELYGKRSKRGVRDPVIDGDTIDVLCDLGYGVKMELRLRLVGINTPESRTRNKAEKVMGLAAKSFLKHLLEEADSIEFLSHDRGKYGRVLAELYTIKHGARTNVNDLLVKTGHAREYHGGKREPWA